MKVEIQKHPETIRCTFAGSPSITLQGRRGRKVKHREEAGMGGVLEELALSRAGNA